MSRKAPVSADVDLRPERIVRRYLDLPKYLDLLRSDKLYLRRADTFTDRFEGALTPIVRRALDEAHRDGEVAYDADTFYRRSRAGSYVSCWSLGAHDNMALWQLYGGATCSVAITSTIGRLVKMALDWQETVLICKVRYIDHFKNPNMIIGSYTDLLRFKHEAYRYEEEVRVVVARHDDGWEKNPGFVHLPVGGLNTLIRSVVVAPEAGRWFFDLIEDVSKKYHVSSPIRRSKLTQLPK